MTKQQAFENLRLKRAVHGEMLRRRNEALELFEIAEAAFHKADMAADATVWELMAAEEDFSLLGGDLRER